LIKAAGEGHAYGTVSWIFRDVRVHQTGNRCIDDSVVQPGMRDQMIQKIIGMKRDPKRSTDLGTLGNTRINFFFVDVVV
jgi:hypothetical protein